jgi:tetratricopeptide (TPR) repeat protein
MKTVLTITMLLGAAALAGAQDRLADQLRKGIVQEEANQNVEKAIQAYQAIVAEFDEGRKTAATALFRLAECYRKAGKREQAVAAYQRVVRDFADQAALVESSRRQLTETFGLAEPRPTRESAETLQLRRELADARKLLETARAREVSREPRSVLSANRRTTAPATPEAAQLELLGQRLADTRRKVETGLMAPSDLREVETQYAAAVQQYQQARKEREANERDAGEARLLTERTLKSVEAEIALVEQQVQSIEKKVKAGIVSPQEPELLRLRRDLLELQRKADELRAALKR